MEPVLHIDALCGAIRGLCFHMLRELSGSFICQMNHHFYLLYEMSCYNWAYELLKNTRINLGVRAPVFSKIRKHAI
jgi:hypothetical protein